MTPRHALSWLPCAVGALALLTSTDLHADGWRGHPRHYRLPPPQAHLAVALPVARIAEDSSVVFDDFVDLGMAAGIAIPFHPCWEFDFELIGYDRLKSERGPSTLLVDPGLVYRWGNLGAGLRAGMYVGEGTPNNIGLIPMVNFVCPFCYRTGWFAELDLPVFVNDADDIQVTFTPQVELGLRF